MRRVAVLGAGISGLAAALTLARENEIEVVVYEASDRAGGVLETIYDGPYLIERSADNFATLIPDALTLCQDHGLASELISPEATNRQAFVLNRGRLLPIPAGFSLMQPTRVRPILQTRTLSWMAKLRLLGEFWVPPRTSDEDESLEAFAVRRLGREAFENLVEPIVSGIFTADPATLSMRATMPQFVEMERKAGGLIRGHLANRKQDAVAAARRASGARYDQFVAPRSGMSSLVRALAEQLPSGALRLSTPVKSLGLESRLPGVSQSGGSQSGGLQIDDLQSGDIHTGGEQRWRIETAGETELFDAVICATPAATTAGLLTAAAPAAAAIVGSIPYASSAVVALVVERAELTGRVDGFGLIVPHKEGRQTLAISYTSNKYPGRVPEEQMLLRIFLGGAQRAQLLDRSDQELLHLATQELREILGWHGKVPRWQAVIRWREAMPQYLVGHVERMRELEQALAPFPTLKLCGAGYAGVGIPQCVRGGKKVAQEVLAQFAKANVAGSQHYTASPRPPEPENFG